MTTRVRMLITIAGSTSIGPGVAAGHLTRGQILEVDDAIARHFCENGYAERKLDGPIGQPFKAS